MWILDEPTTALDEVNTENVMRLVDENAKTVVVATHDIGLLSRFDKIVVMIDGQVIEQGSYHALVERDSYLSRLIKENNQ